MIFRTVSFYRMMSRRTGKNVCFFYWSKKSKLNHVFYFIVGHYPVSLNKKWCMIFRTVSFYRMWSRRTGKNDFFYYLLIKEIQIESCLLLCSRPLSGVTKHKNYLPFKLITCIFIPCLCNHLPFLSRFIYNGTWCCYTEN